MYYRNYTIKYVRGYWLAELDGVTKFIESNKDALFRAIDGY